MHAPPQHEIIESEEIQQERPERHLSPEKQHFVEEETPGQQEFLVESAAIPHREDIIFHDVQESTIEKLPTGEAAESQPIQFEERPESQEGLVENEEIQQGHGIDIISEPTTQFQEIEPYQSLPPEPRPEISPEEEEESGQKMGLGMMLAGAVVLGAKAVGDKALELGEKIKEKIADQGEEEVDSAAVQHEDFEPTRFEAEKLVEESPRTAYIREVEAASNISLAGSEKTESERIKELEQPVSGREQYEEIPVEERIQDRESIHEGIQQPSPIQQEVEHLTSIESHREELQESSPIESQRSEPIYEEFKIEEEIRQPSPIKSEVQEPSPIPSETKQKDLLAPTTEQQAALVEVGSNASLAGSDRVQPETFDIQEEPVYQQTESEVESRVIEHQFEPLAKEFEDEEEGLPPREAQLTESEVEEKVIEHQFERPVTDTLIHQEHKVEPTETGSNESLVGSMRSERERIEMLKEGEVPATEESAIKQESPFDEEEIEILEKDEFLGDYGARQESARTGDEEPHEIIGWFFIKLRIFYCWF